MKPVVFGCANGLLHGGTMADGTHVPDLAVHYEIDAGGVIRRVSSCWELSEEEIGRILTTRRVFISALGATHPPISLAVAEVPPAANAPSKAVAACMSRVWDRLCKVYLEECDPADCDAADPASVDERARQMLRTAADGAR